MPLRNSSANFGSVTKVFHWLVALLILSTIPLGIIATDLADAIRLADSVLNEAMIARTTLLFSLHKTIGVTIFFVALARILWALSQPKPGLLNGDNRVEALVAQTVHWLLYGSLVAVPITGWINHAATTGFSPIWWPFGQNLPFVAKSQSTAELFSALHYLLQWVLVVAVALHIVGALKHHFIDGDATLRRILPGRTIAQPSGTQPGHALPLVAAVVIWAAVLAGGGALGWLGSSYDRPVPAQDHAAQEPDIESASSAIPAPGDASDSWKVRDGELQITIRQLNSDVSGNFESWSADIAYTDAADADGQHGTVSASIAIGSLSLGTVTSQALGADFLNAGAHPTANFQADLISTDIGQVARGTLTIRDQTIPVEIPVVITVNDNMAQASGKLTIDRRDFGIGPGVTDQGSLGFSVDITFDLSAERAG